MLPIALQLYSIRDDMSKDCKVSLQKVKKMGYDGVELAGLYGYSPAEMKAMLSEIGLTPVSAHVPYDDLMADPDGVLNTYKELGCQYVVIPYMTEEFRIGAEKGQEALEGIRSLAESASRHGLTMLYHNHDFEFLQVDGEYALDIIFKTIPKDILKTEIDTCWVDAAGVDVCAYLRKYTGRAPVVHIKDYIIEEGGSAEGAYELIGIETNDEKKASKFEYRPLGYGQQDFPAIIQASVDAGTEWLVVEQDMPSMGKTAMVCADISIRYLKSLR